jgi:hypothetical protein
MKNQNPVFVLMMMVICLAVCVLSVGCAPQVQINQQLRNTLQGRRIAVCSDSYAQQDVVSGVEFAMRQLYDADVVSNRQCGSGSVPDVEFLLKVETSNTGGPMAYMLVNQQCQQSVWVKILNPQGKIVAMGYAESQNVRAAVAIGNGRNFGGAQYRSNETLADLALLATFNLR